MVESFFAFLALAPMDGMPEPKQADVVWVAEGEFCEPETVLPLPDNTLLVSNVCDFRTDGDGYLTLLAADGQVLAARQVDRLDSPLGMTVVDDLIYVVDNNTIKVFYWPSFEEQSRTTLSTAVANDVAVSGDGTIYVTDTAKGEVAVVSPAGKQTKLLGDARFKGANGIHVDGHNLYVGGERLWRVDLRDNSLTTMGPAWVTDIDGIEMEADGTLQVTPVGGPLIRLGVDIEMIGGDAVSSANHGYAGDLGLALIPTGFDNTVIAIRLNHSQAN